MPQRDEKTLTDELAAFFDRRLLPIAESDRGNGIEYFATRPDQSETYYAERNDTSDYVHEIDASDLAAELRSMWAENDPALCAIIDELIGIAAQLQETGEIGDDISPFVYAMF